MKLSTSYPLLQRNRGLAAALIPGISAIVAQQERIMVDLMKSLTPTINLIPQIQFDAILRTESIARAALTDMTWLNQTNQTMLEDILPKMSGFTLPPMPSLGFEMPSGFFDAVRGIGWEKLTRGWHVPSNWPDGLSDLPQLLEIVNNEGIPIAWIPRSSILKTLITAESSEARSEILVAHRDEILEDCIGWVEGLDDELVSPLLPLARKVLAACADGHWEVAAVTAVGVTHSMVETLRWVSDHQRVRKYHRLTIQLPASRLLEQATRAPLVKFYDEWNPKSGQPRPAHLTRHVVSHHLADDQVSARNCVVAVMLMSSLLVTVEHLELGRQAVAA